MGRYPHPLPHFESVKVWYAHGERSKPGAYQTFMDSKCGRGGGCLPTRLRYHGRMLARCHFPRLANQRPGFSHVTGRRRSFLLGPPNFLPPDLQGACCRHKLCNFCARLNHFLGVYGKNEDYHLLRFFVLFVVVYFVFSVDPFFMEKIAKLNRFFSVFFKKVKTGDFVSQFSP